MSFPQFTKVLSFATLLLAVGCESSNSGSASSPTPAAPVADSPNNAEAPTHADADVKPGSYEDWCGEHAVPESMCTRCNAALIPAFKATGDWCAEHGLPESQCLVCNPDLKIERPPRAGSTP